MADSLKQIVEILAPHQLYQLEFLEQILAERRNGKRFDNSILLLYIQLLCQADPDRVIIELKKNDYPLEEVYEICKSSKAIEAQAYLSQKMGHYQDAFFYYTEVTPPATCSENLQTFR